jgi:hypothetical protein
MPMGSTAAAVYIGWDQRTLSGVRHPSSNEGMMPQAPLLLPHQHKHTLHKHPHSPQPAMADRKRQRLDLSDLKPAYSGSGGGGGDGNGNGEGVNPHTGQAYSRRYHEILAKRRGLPVYEFLDELLGKVKKNQVRACVRASCVRWVVGWIGGWLGGVVGFGAQRFASVCSRSVGCMRRRQLAVTDKRGNTSPIPDSHNNNIPTHIASLGSRLWWWRARRARGRRRRSRSSSSMRATPRSVPLSCQMTRHGTARHDSRYPCMYLLCMCMEMMMMCMNVRAYTNARPEGPSTTSYITVRYKPSRASDSASQWSPPPLPIHHHE